MFSPFLWLVTNRCIVQLSPLKWEKTAKSRQLSVSFSAGIATPSAFNRPSGSGFTSSVSISNHKLIKSASLSFLVLLMAARCGAPARRCQRHHCPLLTRWYPHMGADVARKTRCDVIVMDARLQPPDDNNLHYVETAVAMAPRQPSHWLPHYFGQRRGGQLGWFTTWPLCRQHVESPSGQSAPPIR